MRILVAYASRHGATAGIAERIGKDLESAGLDAEARPVAEVEEVSAYDAVILGGASYMFHWLREANSFAHRHRADLASRPVWLFSSGPLGTEKVDKEGRDVLESSRPKEFDELEAVLKPQGEKVFFGAWDPDDPPHGLAERLMRLMPAAREALPAGDFRDWPAVDAWAAEIGGRLKELHKE